MRNGLDDLDLHQVIGQKGGIIIVVAQHQLGDDWESCARFLKPTGRAASTVLDPRHPPRHLELMVDGDEDFVAMDELDVLAQGFETLKISPMPPMSDIFSPQEIADIIAYVATLK